MSYDVIQLALVFFGLFQMTCLVHIARALDRIEKNQRQEKKNLISQDNNIQNDLEKRLFDIQNVRYSRSYPPLNNRRGQ